MELCILCSKGIDNNMVALLEISYHGKVGYGFDVKTVVLFLFFCDTASCSAAALFYKDVKC